MLSQLAPLYLVLPLMSLTAAAFAVHFTLKLRASTLKTPRRAPRSSGAPPIGV